MPQLSKIEQYILANDLQGYLQSLGDYQAQRSLDPGYDTTAMNKLIADATGSAALFAAGNMAVDFVDSQAALRSLNNVIAKAAAYVSNLVTQVNTWNKIAKIGAALGGLIGALGSANPIGVFDSANGLAVAISGDPSKKADPNDPNGL
jgi:hypothetical protein